MSTLKIACDTSWQYELSSVDAFESRSEHAKHQEQKKPTPDHNKTKVNFSSSHQLSDLEIKTCKILEVTSGTEANILKERHQEK